MTGHNGTFNNTTNYSNLTDVVNNIGDDEVLGSSPFAKSGSDTFVNRFSFFEPNDIGNVRCGAYPSGSRLDKGAVQHSDPASGGLLIHPGMSGWARG